MERISICLSVLSFIVSSSAGEYLSLLNEFKFRSTTLIIFLLLSLSFHKASLNF